MLPPSHPAASVLAARASRRKQHQDLPQGEDAEFKGSEVLINALKVQSSAFLFPLDIFQ